MQPKESYEMTDHFFNSLEDILLSVRNQGFNQFDIFEDIFSENSISKVLRFLFNSEGSHSLGSSFVASFLDAVKVRKDIPAIKKLDLQNLDTTSIFNKQTTNKRFIDLVIECRSSNAVDNDFVFAIELKKWDTERENQLSDYQEYLKTNYKCPSIIYFLTPYGKEAKTAKNNSDGVHCRAISYKEVMKACESTSSQNNEVQNFLKNFGGFMHSSIAGKLNSHTQQKINELWQKYKQEMRIVANLGRRPKNARRFIYETLIRALNNHEGIRSAYVDWHYTKGVAVPTEFNLSINKIDEEIKSKRKKPYSIFFMIKCSGNVPAEVSSWTVSVAAWPDSKRYDKTAEKDAKEYQAMFSDKLDGPTIGAWSPWTFFESSKPFIIDDWRSDTEPTIDIILNFIDNSLSRLRTFYGLK